MRATIVISPAGASAAAALGWRTTTDVFATKGGLIVAQSSTTSTVRLEMPDGVAVYLKRYEYPRARIHLMLRASRARREWQSLEAMARCGLPTPAALAWGEERRGCRLLRAFIVTLGIPGGVSLDHLLPGAALAQPAAEGIDDRVRPGNAVAWRPLAHSLIALTAQLHGANRVHGDLHARNIIVAPVANGGARPALYLIDAPRGRHAQSLSARATDLASLVTDLRGKIDQRLIDLGLRLYCRRLAGVGGAGRSFEASLRPHLQRAIDLLLADEERRRRRRPRKHSARAAN